MPNPLARGSFGSQWSSSKLKVQESFGGKCPVCFCPFAGLPCRQASPADGGSQCPCRKLSRSGHSLSAVCRGSEEEGSGLQCSWRAVGTWAAVSVTSPGVSPLQRTAAGVSSRGSCRLCPQGEVNTCAGTGGPHGAVGKVDELQEEKRLRRGAPGRAGGGALEKVCRGSEGRKRPHHLREACPAESQG